MTYVEIYLASVDWVMKKLAGALPSVQTRTGYTLTFFHSNPLKLIYDGEKSLQLYLSRNGDPALLLEELQVDEGSTPRSLRWSCGADKGMVSVSPSIAGAFLHNIGFDPEIVNELVHNPPRLLLRASEPSKFFITVAESALNCGLLTRPDGTTVLCFFALGCDDVPFIVEEIMLRYVEVVGGRRMWGFDWSKDTVGESWWHWNNDQSWSQQGEDKLAHIRDMLLHLGFAPRLVELAAAIQLSELNLD